MSILFLLSLAFLASLKLFAAFVTRRAESKESRAANRVAALHKRLAQTDENATRKRDYISEARRALAAQELGGAIEYSERCADKSLRWGARSEKFGRAVSWLWNAKGRAMPYSAGMVDCTTVMVGLDQLSLATGQPIPGLVASLVSMITG